MAKTDLVKTDFPAIASPGSRPMPWAKHEKYCRLRAAMHPRAQAYREAGWNNRNDDSAYADACRLERRPGVKARIEYLSRQEEELIPEKRRRLEEALWSVHDADIGNFFETVEVAKTNKDGKLATDEAGKPQTVKKQRAKLLSELPADIRKQIEHIHVDSKGNHIPQLYSRSEANRELRKMLNIGGQRAPEQSDVSRLSDAELIRQLADQAKDLGVEINLDYTFPEPTSAASEPTEVNGDQVIDNDSAPTAEPATDVSNPPELTSELSVSSAAPPEARRLPKAGRGRR
jgi:hypothetical protein